MKKLLKGIVDFRKNTRSDFKATFAELALGQKPDTLFVACSDSRVVPNLFASSDPGDLFVVRNVGNLMPPCTHAGLAEKDVSEIAAVEYSLTSLPVRDIIICGHSECGAMIATLSGVGQVTLPNLRDWLHHAEPSLAKLYAGLAPDSSLAPHNQLSQLNVLRQIENLYTYPDVQRRMREGKLRIHGWWFDIANAEVQEYDLDSRRFRVIDEEFASMLMSRL